MNEITKTLKEHDKRFDEHDKRFDAVDKRFDAVDKRFDAVDKRLDAIDKRFDAVDQQIDYIAKKSLEHDDKLEWLKENTVTKQDHQELMNSVDTLVKLAKKKDEEMTMMAHAIQRQGKDIERIKPLVGLA